MKLNYITFMVRDLEKSIGFYKRVIGLTVIKELEVPKGKIAFLTNEVGETMLELIEFPDAIKVSVEGMTVSFITEKDRLLSVRETAISEGFMPSEIEDDGLKPAHFVCLDPDNIEVEISC